MNAVGSRQGHLTQHNQLAMIPVQSVFRAGKEMLGIFAHKGKRAPYNTRDLVTEIDYDIHRDSPSFL
jgi:hypothetical protein